MMDLPTVASPHWANAEQTAINCIVTFGEQDLPFTASANDPEEFGRQLFERAAAGELGAIAPYEPPPKPEVITPQVVSPRQLKLALLGAGLLDDIDAFVAHPSTPRAAQISWEYATEYRRDNPMLNAMAQQMQPPLTEAQIDQLFIAAAAIE